MIVAIADTHTTIWYLFSDSRLGKAASDFIDSAVVKGGHIGVSAISVAELIYLVEKGRIPASAVRDLQNATANPQAVLQYVPLDEHVAMKMADIPRQDLPDLPDRVVAARALFYKVPVLSRDGRIRSSDIETIWQPEVAIQAGVTSRSYPRCWRPLSAEPIAGFHRE